MTKTFTASHLEAIKPQELQDRPSVPFIPSITNILLSEIHADPTWNSRCRAAVTAEGQEDPITGMGSNGMQGLVASIRAAGQNTPLDVIPNKNHVGEVNPEKPFFLVAGFRRFEALSRIAVEDKNPEPRANCIVRELSPLGARMLNLRENTARDDLRGADLAYGVAQLVKEAEGRRLTGAHIAQELNKSVSYISQILKMNKKVSSDLLEHWRNTPGNPVTMVNMFELANLEDPAVQNKTYYELFKGSPPSDGKEKVKSWRDAARKRCAKVGTLLGTLAREFGLNIEPLGEFEECIIRMVKLPADIKTRDVRIMAKAAHDAYLNALREQMSSSEEAYEGDEGNEGDDHEDP